MVNEREYEYINKHINYNDINDIIKLLRGGEYRLNIHQYCCGEPLPTAIDDVLREYIYKNSNKNVFEQALFELLNSSAADVYLSLVYFDNCLYFEKKGDASFLIDKELFIPLIKNRINLYLKEMQDQIKFVDGTVNKQPIKRIKILNAWYEKEYGFNIL